MRDLQTGAVVLVSRASGSMGAAGDGDASGTSISADGRFVAFESFADNLSPDDADGTLDVFVRDIQGEPAGQAGQPGSTPAAGSDITGSDTTGPVILARALARGNGVVRVSKTGRFRLFCGRYREPVSGACAARALRPVGAARGLLLSSKLFRAPAGRSGFVGFRLSPRALASLTAARRVRMLGTVIARDRLGNATRVRFSFTLQAPSVATRRR